jgi:hypothetical protein
MPVLHTDLCTFPSGTFLLEKYEGNALEGASVVFRCDMVALQ